eukprot:COSAG02_NODE_4469_length_5331_cov_1.979931_2_plen_114_part_00
MPAAVRVPAVAAAAAAAAAPAPAAPAAPAPAAEGRGEGQLAAVPAADGTVSLRSEPVRVTGCSSDSVGAWRETELGGATGAKTKCTDGSDGGGTWLCEWPGGATVASKAGTEA